MADILIREVPKHVVLAIDSRAQQAGLSRTQYLRRVLERECIEEPGEVTLADLVRFADAFSDLDNDATDRALL
jgi:hypothetical protein